MLDVGQRRHDGGRGRKEVAQQALVGQLAGLGHDAVAGLEIVQHVAQLAALVADPAQLGAHEHQMHDADKHVQQMLMTRGVDVVELADDDVDNDLDVVEVHQAVRGVVEKRKIQELHEQDLVGLRLDAVEVEDDHLEKALELARADGSEHPVGRHEVAHPVARHELLVQHKQKLELHVVQLVARVLGLQRLHDLRHRLRVDRAQLVLGKLAVVCKIEEDQEVISVVETKLVAVAVVSVFVIIIFGIGGTSVVAHCPGYRAVVLNHQPQCLEPVVVLQTLQQLVGVFGMMRKQYVAYDLDKALVHVYVIVHLVLYLLRKRVHVQLQVVQVVLHRERQERQHLAQAEVVMQSVVSVLQQVVGH